MTPVPLKANANKLLLELQNAKGSPVSGAKITAKTDMPTMSMAGPDLEARETGAGSYQIDANFMSTLWAVDLNIAAANTKTLHLKFDVEVP